MSNPLVPFLIRHGCAGIAAGWTAVAGLLWLDVGSLGTLVLESELAPLPLIMLLAFFALTFASLAMGAAIMGLARDPAERSPAPVEVAPVALVEPAIPDPGKPAEVMLDPVGGLGSRTRIP